MSTIEDNNQSRIIAAPGQSRGRTTTRGVAQRPSDQASEPWPHILRAAHALREHGSQPVQIGRYSVLRILGEGGMGAVYACFDEMLDRKVAVKVLRVGTSNRDVASARLIREGQALARLSHPNVVTVHEVGLTDENVYVAMEFLKGTCLDVWAADNRPWQATLDAFIQAGRGLAAAHKAGIIHRDFKPQNVIVREDGQVKVLDFGLARASGEEVREEWLDRGETATSQASLRAAFMRPLTVTGALVGTPAYMSPEQYCGDPVTATSDQFSFCASLYQCLFGTMPFTTSSYEGLRNDIMAGRVAPIPLRSPVPSWVYRCLCRGMHAFPEQRFASMDELLASLDHRRTSRRARLAAGFAAAALTGVAGFYVAQATDPVIELCPDASAELVGVWDNMRKQEVRTAFEATHSPQATAVFDSVIPQLDTYAQQWRTMRNEACLTHAEGRQADQLFDLRMTCLDQRRAGLTALSEVLVAPEAGNLASLAEATFSLPPLERCADASALLADVRPPENPDLRKRIQQHRESISRAQVFHTAGKNAAGLALLASIANDQEAMDYHPLAAEVELNRGNLEMDVDPTKSAGSFERALVLATRADHQRVAAQASSRLAFVRAIRLNQWELATADLPLVEARNSRFQDDIDLYAEYLNNVGYIQIQTGDRREAVKLLEQAHALRVEHGREKTPLALTTLLNLSVTEFDEGRFEVALQHAQEIHNTANELFGPASFQARFSRQLIAFCSLHLGRPRQAIAVLEQPQGTVAPMARKILAEAELARKNYTQAHAHLETVLSSLPPGTEATDGILHLLMEIASMQGDQPRVQSRYEQTQKQIESTVDSDGFRAAMLQLHYGRALTNLGNGQEALAPLEQLRSAPPENFLTNVPRVAPLLSLALGRAYREVGDLEAAEKDLEFTLEQCGDTRPIHRAEALHELGLVAEARGSTKTASEFFEQAQALYHATAEADFRPLVDNREALARVK